MSPGDPGPHRCLSRYQRWMDPRRVPGGTQGGGHCSLSEPATDSRLSGPVVTCQVLSSAPGFCISDRLTSYNPKLGDRMVLASYFCNTELSFQISPLPITSSPFPRESFIPCWGQVEQPPRRWGHTKGHPRPHGDALRGRAVRKPWPSARDARSSTCVNSPVPAGSAWPASQPVSGTRGE